LRPLVGFNFPLAAHQKDGIPECHNNEETGMVLMNPHPTLRKVRLVAGCALIGSVVAGVCFGWVDLSFDPRAIGATIGTLAGAIKVFHLV
jgi:hypothetical protein